MHTTEEKFLRELCSPARPSDVLHDRKEKTIRLQPAKKIKLTSLVRARVHVINEPGVKVKKIYALSRLSTGCWYELEEALVCVVVRKLNSTWMRRGSDSDACTHSTPDTRT